MTLRIAVLSLFTAAGLALVGAGRADASCAAPPPGDEGPAVIFMGTLVEDIPPDPETYEDLYRFKVEHVERGTLGAEAVVNLAVDRREPGPDGEMRASTSVSLGPAPIVGGVYRVGASEGTDASGAPLLHANACDGFLERRDQGALINDVPDDPTVVVTNRGSEHEPPPLDSDLAHVSGPADGGSDNEADDGQVELAVQPAASEGGVAGTALRWLAALLALLVGGSLLGRRLLTPTTR